MGVMRGGPIRTTLTYNQRRNWTAAGEIALAMMVMRMDLFNRLLGTVPLKAPQFGLAPALPAARA